MSVSVSEPSTPSSDGNSNSNSNSNNEDELLMSDVNAALQSFLENNEEGEANASSPTKKSGARGSVRRLSDLQLTALRNLDQRVRLAIQKNLRKAVTGDENKRVRDHAKQTVRKVVTGSSERTLRDWAVSAPVVKTVDKFSFVLGVFVLCMTEFMALQHPTLFGTYYVVLVSVLMALRLYMYAKSQYLYFLLDFCYWANLSCFVSILLMPDNARLWRLNYAVSNGTLLGALVAWGNSLVFHSLDKTTSIAIHFLPGLLCYLERWSDNSRMMGEDTADNIGWGGAFLDPLLFYVGWQLVYILKTEVVDRERMVANPSIQTSLRWLTRDKKNPMHRIAKKVCRATGILKPDEQFEPECLKTKMVFWIGQLGFIMATFLPVPLLFAYRSFNTTYILLVISAAVFNGSNYYFEVFAARYLRQLEASSRQKQLERVQAEGEGGVKEE